MGITEKNLPSASRARPPRAPDRTKIGGFELFLKFRVSLARALSSNTSLELTALISNFDPNDIILN